MSGFSGTWLELREPADAAARSAALGTVLDQWLRRHRPGPQPLQVLDLGCGTGAGLRWLAPRLRAPQRWLLLDHDRALLAELPERLARWAAARGARVAHDGGAGLQAGPGLHARWAHAELAHALPALHGVHLLTASALLDLVSRRWLARLADACAGAGTALLLALAYDGRVALAPRHAMDPRLRDAVNGHQRRDKGFGPALGPAAAAAAAALLGARGYRVLARRSDWLLGPDQAPLARALLDGWARAATELPAIEPGELARWRRWRAARAGDPGARLRVGHVDLLALPRHRGGEHAGAQADAAGPAAWNSPS